MEIALTIFILAASLALLVICVAFSMIVYDTIKDEAEERRRKR